MSRTQISKTIEILEEHIKKHTDDIVDKQQKIKLLKKYKDKKPPYNNGESEEILTLICYGSLAYCCGLNKGCVWRDSALNLLDVSTKDYLKLKKEFHDKIMNGKTL